MASVTSFPYRSTRASAAASGAAASLNGSRASTDSAISVGTRRTAVPESTPPIHRDVKIVPATRMGTATANPTRSNATTRPLRTVRVATEMPRQSDTLLSGGSVAHLLQRLELMDSQLRRRLADLEREWHEARSRHPRIVAG